MSLKGNLVGAGYIADHRPSAAGNLVAESTQVSNTRST